MSSVRSGNSSVAGSRDHSRSLLALLLVASMLISALPLMVAPASSDPWYGDDGDMTRSVSWNFTDPAGYSLENTSVSGGLGTLAFVNTTVGENTTADYEFGTGLNVDLHGVPDAIQVNNSSLSVQTLMLQPGPEGNDNYLDEWFPYWSPPNGSDLNLNGNYDPNPVVSKRAYVIMEFNLSSVPAGATIQTATLMLYEKGGKVMPVSYTIHALNVSWNEVGVSWRTRDAFPHSWQNPGGDYSVESFSSGVVDGANGWHYFDLTRLVDLWTRGMVPNLGFVIVANPTVGDSLKTFTDCECTNRPDQRPILQINYTLGVASAIFNSRALGEGLNSTFTLASWGTGIVSKATDEFASSSLSPRWQWLSDPRIVGGTVDLESGWLNITGSTSTNLTTGVNFLHQAITGDFTFDTSLQDQFAADSMAAGILLRNSDRTWLAIYREGVGSSGRIVAEFSNSRINTTLGSIPWSVTTTFLRMERIGGTYNMLGSPDGSNWTLVASLAPQYDFTRKADVGLCIFSGGSALRPVVAFDYARIQPLGQTVGFGLSTRTGNSTVLTDPSWRIWSAPVTSMAETVIGAVGKYVQYRFSMSSAYDWISPVFTGFECHLERFDQAGTITTFEATPPALSAWETLSATRTIVNGLMLLYYSVDHGNSWNYLGSEANYSIASTQPSIMIMIQLMTYDTLSSPSVDAVELIYSITHASFYVSAPRTVVAGEFFSLYIEPKDTNNNTASWTGDIVLDARDATGVFDATGQLAVTSDVVPGGGHLTITNERYDVAEVIRILVSGGGGIGMSSPITVLPGPVYSISMDPNITALPEDNSTMFTVIGLDAFGNVNNSPGMWHADASLGVLNSTTGRSVWLTTVGFVSGGYLNVTIGSHSVSRYIVVAPFRSSPEIETLPTQTKPEDYGSWTLDLTPYVSDSEDALSDLKWYTVNESIVSVNGENRTGNMVITFTTISNLFGTDHIELRVVDTDRQMSRADLTIEITPVNDPPTIGPIDPLVVRHGDPYLYDLSYYVHDVEESTETLTLSVDAASSPYVHADGFWLTFMYPSSMNGTQQTVIVTVSDGEYSASAIILVTIGSDYVPISRGVLPNLVMNQGEIRKEYFDLDDYFTDPDGEVLIYAYGNTHINVMIQVNHTVDFYAPTNWYGEEFIVFRAVDQSGARAESAMTVTVLQVNQPPIIRGVPDLVVRFGQQYVLDLHPYITDLDDDDSELYVTTNDSHALAEGLLLILTYPSGMTGLTRNVRISVSDGALSDWWAINVTISTDNPPVNTIPPPDHSFLEDTPIPYPVSGHLSNFFSDPDNDPLTFAAFVSTPNMTAEAVAADGDWTVTFHPEENWNGITNLTLRAVDGAGALAETTILLTVIPVGDSPVLSLPESYSVEEGAHSILDITENIVDPDSALTDFRYVLDSEYADCLSVLNGIIVFQFPADFLNSGEKERVIQVTITVFDQDNLFSSDTMNITVTRSKVIVTPSNPLVLIAFIASAGAATVLSAVLIIRRKKPLVIRDMMLIHNDGFLISRHASPHKGEIDEDVLSGMLTAVLNFVEDSMSSSQDQLKTFGFKEYQVLVTRGSKTFIAVVYEGDVPEGFDKALNEFIAKIERIYKKKITDWTGDIETDFAGANMLLEGFVKEHDKSKGRKASGDMWTSGKKPADTGPK